MIKKYICGRIRYQKGAYIVETVVKLVSTKQASLKQRMSLHQMLSEDEEYGNLGDRLHMAEEITTSLVKDVEGRAILASDKNVMQIVYLDVQGYPNTLIARQLGILPQQVSAIKSSDAYIATKEGVMGAVMAEARKYMQISSIKAVKTLLDCMGSSSEKIRLAAASDVLNRIGMTAPQQIELISSANGFGNFTEDELAEIVRKEALPKGAVIVEHTTKDTD